MSSRKMQRYFYTHDLAGNFTSQIEAEDDHGYAGGSHCMMLPSPCARYLSLASR